VLLLLLHLQRELSLISAMGLRRSVRLRDGVCGSVFYLPQRTQPRLRAPSPFTGTETIFMAAAWYR
jgi:hypothetical protein